MKVHMQKYQHQSICIKTDAARPENPRSPQKMGERIFALSSMDTLQTKPALNGDHPPRVHDGLPGSGSYVKSWRVPGVPLHKKDEWEGSESTAPIPPNTPMGGAQTWSRTTPQWHARLHGKRKGEGAEIVIRWAEQQPSQTGPVAEGKQKQASWGGGTLNGYSCLLL